MRRGTTTMIDEFGIVNLFHIMQISIETLDFECMKHEEARIIWK